jgi:hypothetical protein
LFFLGGEKLMAVDIARGAAFSASAPRVVHQGRFLASINGNTGWSISKDGTRVLRVQQVDTERAITRIDLVLHWFDEVRRRVAAAK